MKKLFLMMMCAFLISTNLMAKELVPLSVSWGDDMCVQKITVK